MRAAFYFLLAFLCVGVLSRALPQDDGSGDFGDGGGSEIDTTPPDNTPPDTTPPDTTPPDNTPPDTTPPDTTPPDTTPPDTTPPNNPPPNTTPPDTTPPDTTPPDTTPPNNPPPNTTPPDTSSPPVDTTPPDTSAAPVNIPPPDNSAAPVDTAPPETSAASVDTPPETSAAPVDTPPETSAAPVDTPPETTAAPVDTPPETTAAPVDTTPPDSTPIATSDDLVPETTLGVTSDGLVEPTATPDVSSAAASDDGSASTAAETDTSPLTATDTGDSSIATATAVNASPSAASDSDQGTQTATDQSVLPTAVTSSKPQKPNSGDQSKGNKSTPAKTPSSGAPPKTAVSAFVAYIRQVYKLAQQHGGRNPNQLVMEWLRHEDYDNYKWTALVSAIDGTFTKLVQSSGVQMIRTLKDPETGIDIHISHFGACMNGVFMFGQAANGATNRADVTGWGGDLVTFYGDWQKAVHGGTGFGAGHKRRDASLDGGREDIEQHVDKRASISGGDYTRRYLATRTDDTTFKLRDMIEDADCYNIGMKLQRNPSLNIADLIEDNLTSGYRTRMQRFFNGRFGSAANAQASAKNDLSAGWDLLVNAGKTALIIENAGVPATLPTALSSQQLDDFTKGFADRMQTLVAAEASGTL